MVFARMPYWARSRATGSVIPTMPPLERVEVTAVPRGRLAEPGGPADDDR